MSVKLSELLEAGASLLSLEAENFSECGADDYSQQAADEAKALRAIAPALVEALKAAKAYRNDPDSCWTAGAYEHLETTWAEFLEAMTETGVTCE